jgi:hypothetical protein
MAKKQTFADKMTKKSDEVICPVCNGPKQFVKHVKAVKTESGAWKFRSATTGVCKCNEKEIYA